MSAANKYPWCLVDTAGVVAANFETEEMAYRCMRYFSSWLKVEHRP